MSITPERDEVIDFTQDYIPPTPSSYIGLSPDVDVAVGQVESDRLREVVKLPPEVWDQRYPQHPFAKPLTYRRTMVLVKGADANTPDYFVVRDQFWSPEPLSGSRRTHPTNDPRSWVLGSSRNRSSPSE